MDNHLPLTDEEGEVRELTEEDFARAIPFSSLPAEHQQVLLSLKRPVEQTFPIPVSAEVVRKFQSTGEGWEHRIDLALRDWLRDHAA